MTAELFEVRLKFERMVSKAPEQIVEEVKEILAQNQDEIVGRVMHNHIRIRIIQEKRHFWSPELSLLLEETGTETEVRGRYGPKPDIWLGYMFTYFFLGFLTVGLTIYGLSRYNLGLSHYILWLVPVLLGGVLALFLSSKAGQKLGHDEVRLIQNLVVKPVLYTKEGKD